MMQYTVYSITGANNYNNAATLTCFVLRVHMTNSHTQILKQVNILIPPI